MGLNRIHPYIFLEGHICAVAYCNVELAVFYLDLVMINGIRASDPHGLNKGCGSKFHADSQV